MALKVGIAMSWLLACSSPPEPMRPALVPEPRVPATVARLFERGAKWTFPTAVKMIDWDDDRNAIETNTTGTLTCEVTGTVRRKDGWGTALTCSATPELPTPFPMDLYATSAGLFEHDGGAALLDEPPKVRSSSETDEGAEGSRSSDVSNHETRWCFSSSEAIQGSSSDWSMCLRAGDFVGGRSERGSDKAVRIKWGDSD